MIAELTSSSSTQFYDDPRTPFYSHVPKTLAENLRFRRQIIGNARNDENYRAAVWSMCSRDILFWVNTFGWTYNPKLKPAPTVIPFITFARQDELLLELKDWQAGSIAIPKSREVGASWLCIAAIGHEFQFSPDMVSFLMASRKEEYVDAGHDPKTLFYKLMFMIRRQPIWLQPRFEKIKMHLVHTATGSTVDGEATNPDIGRGGRFLAILIDEAASVENLKNVRASATLATDCVIYNSTPKGSNEFYKVCENPAVRRFDIHWTQDPRFCTDITWDANGKPTSSWYRKKAAELHHPRLVGQELDLDFLSSDFQWFPQETLDRVKKDDCRPPLYVGRLEFDPQTGRNPFFVRDDNGPLKIWSILSAAEEPPHDRPYGIGADISTGSGASNSAACVIDKKTGEQVAEYVNGWIPPHEFAAVCVALGYFFHWTQYKGDSAVDVEALLAWEANGIGQVFGRTVKDLQYSHIYFDRKEKKQTQPQTVHPGWWSTKQTKITLLGELMQAMGTGAEPGKSATWRSESLIEECEHYVMTAGGVMHRGQTDSDDPNEGEGTHGDRVVAAGIAYRSFRTSGWMVPKKPEPSRHSFAGRKLAWQKKRQEDDYW